MRFPWQQRRDEQDSALDEEIRTHFAMAVAERIERGESPEAAVAAARREFGNLGHVKEVTREMWGGLWVERLLQDLRYALRSLKRSPGFTAVAVLTLALGIGVNTAMFTVMNGVLLRPLPFADPDRLYLASYQPPRGPFTPAPGLYDRHYLTVEKHNDIFAGVTTFSTTNVTLLGVGEPARLIAGEVTSDFFGVLGATPALGRAFTKAQVDGGDASVAVLSARLWRSRFSADPNVLGRVIDVDGTRRTVIGVMPETFRFPAYSDLWIPTRIVPRDGNVMTRPVVGRLKPSLTVVQSRQAWTRLATQLELIPDMKRGELSPSLLPLKDVVVGDARRPLLIFAGAVAFVLLIACANVANLLLMRVTSRDREMAVRAALGAGRMRLIRQMLTETFTIAAAGSLLGIVVALATVRLLLAMAPSALLPRAENVHLDGWVLLFTMGLVLATTIVCGLIPALHATEGRLRSSLAEGARTVTSGHGRLRAVLVVGEIALALVLLTGAGLMLRSFYEMRSVELGFKPSNVLTAQVSLPTDRYPTADAMKAFHQKTLDEMARLSNVGAVGAVNWRPLGRSLISGDFVVEGGPALRKGWSDKPVVTPDYFRAMGMPLLRGRAFTSADRVGAPGVAIVSESVVRKFWPSGDAVGKRISMNDKPDAGDWLTVVGVVPDVVQQDVTTKRGPAVYLPMAQTTFPFFVQGMTYVVRPVTESAALAAAMRTVLRQADPLLPLESVTAMTDLVSSSMVSPRFQSQVLVTFSLLALALAMIGIYGVLAYGVAQRMHEIGVRVALGASPGAVKAMVLRRTAALTIPGVVIGIAVSLGVTRVLAKFLFQVKPTDPATYIVVGVLLAGVAFAAAYLPARRASRVDPLIALRRD